MLKGTKINRPRRVFKPANVIQERLHTLMAPAYPAAPTVLRNRIIDNEKRIRAIIKHAQSGLPMDNRIARWMNQRIGAGAMQDRVPLWKIAKQFCEAVQQKPVRRPKEHLTYDLP